MLKILKSIIFNLSTINIKFFLRKGFFSLAHFFAQGFFFFCTRCHFFAHHCIWIKVHLCEKSKNSVEQWMDYSWFWPSNVDFRIGNLYSNVFDNMSCRHISSSNIVGVPWKSTASSWISEVQRQEYSHEHVNKEECKADQIHWSKPNLIILMLI